MKGLLCIHGFTGSPKEVEPLAKYMGHHTDWLVSVPILPGHGEKLFLRDVRFQDWIRCAEQELLKLLRVCDEVYICGFSMGGLIASFLAANYPVKKIILLNAAAYYTNPKMFFKEIWGLLKRRTANNAEKETLERYKRKLLSTPLAAYLEFRKLVQYTRPYINRVEAPAIIIQGKKDPLVPIKSARYIYDNIGSVSKQLMLVEGADHMICYSGLSAILFTEIRKFIDEKRVSRKNCIVDLIMVI